MYKSLNLPGVEIFAPVTDSYAEILTPEAVSFIVDLQRVFNQRRKELLNARHERQKRIDAAVSLTSKRTFIKFMLHSFFLVGRKDYLLQFSMSIG